MAKLAEDLGQEHLRLTADCPEQNDATRESIIRWLLGNDLERFEMRDQTRLKFPTSNGIPHLTASLPD